MGINIHTNVSSLNAQRHLGKTTVGLTRSVEHLASGYRINRASDDAAGLAITEEMMADLRSIHQASRNANDAVSMVQTAEGAMDDISGMLHRLRELAMQSASDGVNDTQRGYINTEVGELLEEIDRIAGDSEYNGTALLDGTLSASFQVGLDTGDTIDVELATAMDTTGLTINAIDMSTKAGADSALASIDTALQTISGTRAELGAKENRLDVVHNNLDVRYENLASARARIREVDIAAGMAEMTKYQILLQAGTSMTSQANSIPQVALSLLGQ
jgi:flagellin